MMTTMKILRLFRSELDYGRADERYGSKRRWHRVVMGTLECCNPDLYSNLDVKAKEDNAPLKWSNLEEALRLSSSNDIHQFL